MDIVSVIIDKVFETFGVVKTAFKVIAKTLTNVSSFAETNMRKIKDYLNDCEKKVPAIKPFVRIYKFFYEPIRRVNELVLTFVTIYDCHNDYTLSKGEKQKTGEVTFRDWSHIEDENLDVGDMAYSYKEISKDKFEVNISFDSTNNPVYKDGTTDDNIKTTRRKGKYLFCKQVVEDIYNNVSYGDKSISTHEGKIVSESYKIVFFESKELKRSIALVYEEKRDEYKFICAYEVNERHNRTENYTVSIMDMDQKDIYDIKEDIIMNNIKNSEVVSLKDIVKDCINQLITSIVFIGSVILFIKGYMNKAFINSLFSFVI